MLRNSIRQLYKTSRSPIRILTQFPSGQLRTVTASTKHKDSVENIQNSKTEQIPTNFSDNLEVKHHEKFASDWWNSTGSIGPLHAMNTIRVPFIRDGLISTGKVDPDLIDTERVLKDLNVLEVGCGGGILTEQLGRLHANVTGIDLSDKLIEIARDHLKTESPELSDRIQYKIESIERYSKCNQNKYDAVIVSEVLEHVDEKVKFLSACVDALKPGGSIFITTFNKTFASFLGGIVAAEYVLRLVPKGTHHWNKFIPPIEIQRILESSNCSVVLVNGLFYYFWKNTWKWIPSTAVSYAMQAVKHE